MQAAAVRDDRRLGAGLRRVGAELSIKSVAELGASARVRHMRKLPYIVNRAGVLEVVLNALFEDSSRDNWVETVRVPLLRPL